MQTKDQNRGGLGPRLIIHTTLCMVWNHFIVGMLVATTSVDVMHICVQVYCSVSRPCWLAISVSNLISSHLYRKVFVSWIDTAVTGLLYCQLKHTVTIPSAMLYCRSVLVILYFYLVLTSFDILSLLG